MSIFVAVLAGSLLSLAVTLLAVRRLAASRWLWPATAPPPRWSPRVPGIAAIACYPIAWLAGYIVGATLGGGLGSGLALHTGLSERLWVPIGLGLGFFACTAGIATAAALLAFALARCIERARLKQPS